VSDKVAWGTGDGEGDRSKLALKSSRRGAGSKLIMLAMRDSSLAMIYSWLKWESLLRYEASRSWHLATLLPGPFITLPLLLLPPSLLPLVLRSVRLPQTLLALIFPPSLWSWPSPITHEAVIILAGRHVFLIDICNPSMDNTKENRASAKVCNKENIRSSHSPKRKGQSDRRYKRFGCTCTLQLQGRYTLGPKLLYKLRTEFCL
jgi:hypothetical protein